MNSNHFIRCILTLMNLCGDPIDQNLGTSLGVFELVKQTDLQPVPVPEPCQ